MKIRETLMYGVKDTLTFHDGTKKEGYADLHTHPKTTQLYVGKKTILSLHVSENPNGEYWAWWDSKRNQFKMVSHVKSGIDICFPYGVDAEEEAGKGNLLRVTIALP